MISSLASVETLWLLYHSCGTLGSSVMEFLSGILTFCQRNLETYSSDSSILHVVVWSCNRGMGAPMVLQRVNYCLLMIL